MTNPTEFSELPGEIKCLIDVSLVSAFLAVLFLSAYLVACCLGGAAGAAYGVLAMVSTGVALERYEPRAKQKGIKT